MMVTENDIYQVKIDEYSLIDGVVSFLDFSHGWVVRNNATNSLLLKNSTWVPVEYYRSDDYMDTVFVDLPAALDAYNKTLQ